MLRRLPETSRARRGRKLACILDQSPINNLLNSPPMIPDSAPYAVDLTSYQIRSSNAVSDSSYNSAILCPPRLPPGFGAFFVSLWDPPSVVGRFGVRKNFVSSNCSSARQHAPSNLVARVPQQTGSIPTRVQTSRDLYVLPPAVIPYLVLIPVPRSHSCAPHPSAQWRSERPHRRHPRRRHRPGSHPRRRLRHQSRNRQKSPPHRIRGNGLGRGQIPSR